MSRHLLPPPAETAAPAEAATPAIAPTPTATAVEDGISTSVPAGAEPTAGATVLMLEISGAPVESVWPIAILGSGSAIGCGDRSGESQAIGLNGGLLGIAAAQKKFGIRDRQGRDGADAVGQYKLAGSVKDMRPLSLN